MFAVCLFRCGFWLALFFVTFDCGAVNAAVFFAFGAETCFGGIMGDVSTVRMIFM